MDSPSAGSPASRDGTVRTVRLHSGLARFRVGGLVAVRGAKLPDGTFSAAAVRRLGRARASHVRGTVVQRLARRLVVSAGGSVFALGVTGKQLAADGGGLAPGDRVDCDVRFEHGAPETPTGGIRQVGHDGQLVLEGIYLTTDDDGTIELAVVLKGRVLVAVPAGSTLPAFTAGDVVVLIVTVDGNGSFTRRRHGEARLRQERRRRVRRQGARLGLRLDHARRRVVRRRGHDRDARRK
ncbi:MAG TPA: hypothetical protein VFJ75_10065, partial [Gaiellaceae bacterium]|nr:hypothetical protein [Gaiellaceae bacterium]